VISKEKTSLFIMALVTASPGAAMAYIGPGAGLSAIGTVIALIGAVILGIVGFLWYPIKRILNRNKDDDTTGEEPPEQ
jgi:hypothetical protein